MSTWLLITIAGLTLLGLVMLASAAFARRRGDTRFCRKCGYDLTGNTSGRCSECGSDLAARNAVVIGTRHRRRARVIVGLVLLLAGGLPTAYEGRRWLRSFDSYTVFPTAWLMRALASPGTLDTQRAAGELNRRIQRESLSERQASRLIDFWLDVYLHVRFCYVKNGSALDELATLYNHYDFSLAQKKRLFEDMDEWSLEIRPRVARGDAIPLRVRTSYSSVWNRVNVRYTAVDARVDGRAWTIPHLDSERGMGDNRLGLLQCNEPGAHELALDLQIEYVDLPPVSEAMCGSVGIRPATYTYVRTATGSFVVLAEEPPDLVNVVYPTAPSMIPWPGVAPLYVDLFATVEGHGLIGDGGYTPAPPLIATRYISASISIRKSLPIALAYHATGYCGERVFDFGYWTVPKGESGWWDAAGASVDLPEDLHCDRLTLVLTPSVEAAKRTVEIFEIWGGEMRFENVLTSPRGFWCIDFGEPPIPFRAKSR